MLKVGRVTGIPDNPGLLQAAQNKPSKYKRRKKKNQLILC
jgi:hypothetical protein